MTVSVLAAFWAVSFLFVITPGVDWAYVISAGIRGRWVVPAVAGLLSGHLLATLIVAAGAGALLANNPAALSAMTLVGAAYLLWMGVNMLCRPSAPSAGDDKAESWSRWAVRGFCVSGLNPKVFLLFLALLPQFTDPLSNWPVATQILALGLLHLVSCGIIYLLVGYGARSVLQARPAAARNVSRLSGVAMIAIAAVLLGERLLA